MRPTVGSLSVGRSGSRNTGTAAASTFGRAGLGARDRGSVGHAPTCRGNVDRPSRTELADEPFSTWVVGAHTADGVTHPVYRKGTGRGSSMIHELPGLTPECIRFGEEIVARGHTVVMPVLFGTPGAPCRRARCGVARRGCA